MSILAPKRILYLSCHSILEYDEIKLLNELGYYVFSPGAYVEPRNPGDASLRPGLAQIEYDPDDVRAYHSMPCTPGVDHKDMLTKEFVDRFDIVLVMHLPRWIYLNWNNIKHKPVIWRTIGQSIVSVENELRPYRQLGMKIVRYSPAEASIPNWLGQDACIRFYKDPKEFSGYSGDQPYIMTVNQSLPERRDACNYNLYQAITRDLPRRLYGPGNDKVGHGVMGKVSYDEMKMAMRNNRAYLYLGTHPASYTLNFIEAMMTGIPMVCPGKKYGDAWYFPGHALYEIPNIIQHGINGFVSDDPKELIDTMKQLLADQPKARAIGAAGRETAIRLFGKDTIKAQWAQFIGALP